MSGQEIAKTNPGVGQTVRCLTHSHPTQPLLVKIAEVEPAGSRKFSLPELTDIGGGAIPVHPETFEAGQPYFEVTLVFDENETTYLEQGTEMRDRFHGECIPSPSACTSAFCALQTDVKSDPYADQSSSTTSSSLRTSIAIRLNSQFIPSGVLRHCLHQ